MPYFATGGSSSCAVPEKYLFVAPAPVKLIEPSALTQGEFATLVKADAVEYERIVREQGIKLE